MSSLREVVAHSLNATHLEPCSIREVPVDRVGALGRCTWLGGYLWHWLYAGHMRFAEDAQRILLIKAARATRIKPDTDDFLVLERACQIALTEWMNANCRGCKGARELRNEDLLIVCEVCGGTGVHRYTDGWRSRNLKVSMSEYRGRWESRLQAIADILSYYDPLTERTIKHQLK